MHFNHAILLAITFLTSPLWGMVSELGVPNNIESGTICSLWEENPITYASDGTLHANTCMILHCTTNTSLPYPWVAMPISTLQELLDKKIPSTLVSISLNNLFGNLFEHPCNVTFDIPCSLSEDPLAVTILHNRLNAEEKAFKDKRAHDKTEQSLLDVRVLARSHDGTLMHVSRDLSALHSFNSMMHNQDLFTKYMLIKKEPKKQFDVKIIPSPASSAICYDRHGIPTSHEHIQNMNPDLALFCRISLSVHAVKDLLEYDIKIVKEFCLHERPKTLIDLHIHRPDDLQELSSLQRMYTAKETVFFSSPPQYIKESEQNLIEKKVLNRLDNGTYTHGPLGLGKIIPFNYTCNNTDLRTKVMLLSLFIPQEPQ